MDFWTDNSMCPNLGHDLSKNKYLSLLVLGLACSCGLDSPATPTNYNEYNEFLLDFGVLILN